MEVLLEVGVVVVFVVGVFFKKKIQNKNIWKWLIIDDGDEEEENVGFVVNKGKIVKKGVGWLEFNFGVLVGIFKV